MEIEFNPGRNTVPDASQPVARRTPAQSTSDTSHFDRTRALERQLNELPAVRPEKVERGRALIADVKYPPTELVDRIANLLAIHAKRS